MNSKRRVIVTLVTVVVGVSLVACASTASVDTAKENQGESIEPSKPLEVSYEVGATVTPETPLADGQSAYKLADGSHVVVQSDKPFPNSVMTDINAKAEAIVDANTTNDLKNREAYGGAEVLANSIVRSTGKHVLVATQIYSYSVAEDSSAKSYRWILVGVDASEYTINASKEQIIADAEAIIQTKPNPAEWMVVVA